MNRTSEFLDPHRCCLFVVDPQERLMAAIHRADRVVRNAVLMVRCARTLGIPILASTQYRKGLGPFVPELAKLLIDVPCADKTEFNALANQGVQQLVAQLPTNIDTFLLVGVEAHICVYQTAIGALRAGYKPWLIADAVSSREKRHTGLALSRMQAMGMAVGPAEMVVYELLGKAGTPEFKAVLPYLK